jgi:aminoglycoside 3-N-acetyltransferase
METEASYLSIATQCGLVHGETIYLATNITRIALYAKKNKEKFNTEDFIHSFTKIIGQEGTLMIPAFNHHLKTNEKFDYLKTPPETGIIAQTAMRMKEFKRTNHPLHSFFVWGKNQSELCRMNNKTSFGSDSPFAYLFQNNATMLVIDLDLQSSLTFAHFSEELEKVKYRKWKSVPIKYTDENSRQEIKIFRQFRKKPGFINNVNPMLKIFLENGAAEKYMIHQIPIIKLQLSKVHSLIKSDIHNNKAKNIVYFSYRNWMKDIIKLILGRS